MSSVTGGGASSGWCFAATTGNLTPTYPPYLSLYGLPVRLRERLGALRLGHLRLPLVDCSVLVGQQVIVAVRGGQAVMARRDSVANTLVCRLRAYP